MSTASDLHHELSTSAELDELVRSTLTSLGVTYADLQEQAKVGRFQSEALRRAWFAIEGLSG